MADVLVAPVDAPLIYIIIAAAMLVIFALWMGWRITRLRAKPRMSRTQVTAWRTRIDELRARYDGGDERVYALALAKLLREFGTERTGADMRAMTADEIDALHPGFAELLRSLEEPSFSPLTDGVEDVTARAKAAVGAW